MKQSVTVLLLIVFFMLVSAACMNDSAAAAPRWYGYVELEEGNLYWDINSIFVCTQAKHTTIEVQVKCVWNSIGLEKRKHYLKLKQPQISGIESLHHTLIGYQFLVGANTARVLSEADYDDAKEQISLLGCSAWGSIEKGSREDWAKKIALNWIGDREGPDSKEL